LGNSLIICYFPLDPILPSPLFEEIDFNIGLDVTGIGKYYADRFKDYGIKIYEIKPGKII
jgi:hypothetical protein